MFKKFIDGLIFGAGFGVAFIGLWFLASIVIFPLFFESQSGDSERPEFSSPRSGQSAPSSSLSRSDIESFFEASVDEQIEMSSAIALAEYEPSDYGLMRAIIREYLKIEPGTKLQFDVGDEYPSSSFYPSEGEKRGEGLVLFFTGPNAQMISATAVHDGRIIGLNDIPMKLFRDKCAASGN